MTLRLGGLPEVYLGSVRAASSLEAIPQRIAREIS